MKKKIILHIGPHKTGSTALQNTLYRHSSELRSKGLAYDSGIIAEHTGHHRIASSLRRGNLNLFKDALDEEDLPIQVFSSEVFCTLQPAQIASMASVLNDKDITLVFYKRAYSSLIPSIWQETIKHGETHSGWEFLDAVTRQPAEVVALNAKCFAADDTLHHWMTVFPNARLIVKDYEAVSEHRGLVSDFFASVLQQRAPFFKSLGVNQSFKPAQVELMRQVNLCLGDAKAGSPPNKKAINPVEVVNGESRTLRPMLQRIEDNLVTVELRNIPVLEKLEHQFAAAFLNDKKVVRPASFELLKSGKDLNLTAEIQELLAKFAANQLS